MNHAAVIEHVSSARFDATVERLVNTIGAAGRILFVKINHAAGAREVGMVLPASTVLIYGHPKGATPIMMAVSMATLDMPLRVLVRDGGQGVGYDCVSPGWGGVARAGRGRKACWTA